MMICPKTDKNCFVLFCEPGWCRAEEKEQAKTGLPDPVNHPPHYTSHPSGIEAIQVCRHFNFNLGNVIKYLWRASLKGAALEDLKKARWYLDDEIREMEARGKGEV